MPDPERDPYPCLHHVDAGLDALEETPMDVGQVNTLYRLSSRAHSLASAKWREIGVHKFQPDPNRPRECRVCGRTRGGTWGGPR